MRGAGGGPGLGAGGAEGGGFGGVVGGGAADGREDVAEEVGGVVGGGGGGEGCCGVGGGACVQRGGREVQLHERQRARRGGGPRGRRGEHFSQQLDLLFALAVRALDAARLQLRLIEPKAQLSGARTRILPLPLQPADARAQRLRHLAQRVGGVAHAALVQGLPVGEVGAQERCFGRQGAQARVLVARQGRRGRGGEGGVRARELRLEVLDVVARLGAGPPARSKLGAQPGGARVGGEGGGGSGAEGRASGGSQVRLPRRALRPGRLGRKWWRLIDEGGAFASAAGAKPCSQSPARLHRWDLACGPRVRSPSSRAWTWRCRTGRCSRRRRRQRTRWARGWTTTRCLRRWIGASLAASGRRWRGSRHFEGGGVGSGGRCRGRIRVGRRLPGGDMGGFGRRLPGRDMGGVGRRLPGRDMGGFGRRLPGRDMGGFGRRLPGRDMTGKTCSWTRLLRQWRRVSSLSESCMQHWWHVDIAGRVLVVGAAIDEAREIVVGCWFMYSSTGRVVGPSQHPMGTPAELRSRKEFRMST